MQQLIRGAVAHSTLLPDALTPVVVDLSVTTLELSEGGWLQPDASERVLRRRARQGSPAVTRWGEYRLTRTRPLAPRGHAATLAVGVELLSTAALAVSAPFEGVLSRTPDGIVLTGEDHTLWIDGLGDAPASRSRVAAGAPLGILPAETVGRVQLSRPGAERPSFFVTPGEADEAMASSPDPSGVLGIDVRARTTAPDDLLRRRAGAFAEAQEHYYARPPQIERGWREFLIDTRAQTYVDVVNNVTLAGHAHPGVVAAASRQWALLNTNSRFHYEAVAELSERLAALAPAGLERVFLVNSGSEAVDLALRLAMTATGRDRILAAREAYHGWTIGSDAVSTSIGDNPRALVTRPSWVELLDAPNPVRGTHRGADSAQAYLADVDVQLAALDERERIAGVLLEPIFGNGGGVLLPDGYLAGVYERVRALGGVCISDEVQVGYARLGHYFWGFQQQRAVPDIIAVAKAMGNGQPLGAVITTRAIAEAFEQDGSFFSSAGGSPVSCRVGIAVLDALEDEDLQGNARRVGMCSPTSCAPCLHGIPRSEPCTGWGSTSALNSSIRPRASRRPRWLRRCARPSSNTGASCSPRATTRTSSRSSRRCASRPNRSRTSPRRWTGPSRRSDREGRYDFAVRPGGPTMGGDVSTNTAPGSEHPKPPRRRAGRPAQPVLSAQSIAEAGLSLLDESGDFTIGGLARRLGVGPSALYNHVSGKEEVLARIRELVSDRIDVSAFGELPFFDALAVWAWSYRDAFARHSATVAVFATTPLAGAARTTAMYERVVTAFLDAGWPDSDVLFSMVALEDFILGAALDAVAPSEMFETEDPALTPALARVRRAQRTAHPDGSATDLAFQAGLDAMLAGLRRRSEDFPR